MSYSEYYWLCRDCPWRSESWYGDGPGFVATQVPDNPRASMILEGYDHASHTGHTTYCSGFNADEGMEIGPSNFLLDVALQGDWHPEMLPVHMRRARDRVRSFGIRALSRSRR